MEDKKYSIHKEVMEYTLFTLYYILKVSLIVINIYLTISFPARLRKRYPILYEKIKRKFLLFQFFIMLLLVSRLISFTIFVIKVEENSKFEFALEWTITLSVTEVLPSVLLMISFLAFKVNSRGNLDSTDNHLTPPILSVNNSYGGDFYRTDSTDSALLMQTYAPAMMSKRTGHGKNLLKTNVNSQKQEYNTDPELREDSQKLNKSLTERIELKNGEITIKMKFNLHIISHFF